MAFFFFGDTAPAPAEGLSPLSSRASMSRVSPSPMTRVLSNSSSAFSSAGASMNAVSPPAPETWANSVARLSEGDSAAASGSTNIVLSSSATDGAENRSLTLPICRRSPGLSDTEPRTRLSLRNVPCELPRSSTITAPSFALSLRCCRETRGSSSTTSQERDRPKTICSLSSGIASRRARSPRTPAPDAWHSCRPSRFRAATRPPMPARRAFGAPSAGRAPARHRDRLMNIWMNRARISR